MSWFSNSTPRVSWLCALGYLAMIFAISPLHADKPASLTSPGVPPASDVEQALAAYLEQHLLKAHQRVYGDLDGDEVADIVAHAVGPDANDSSLLIVLGHTAELGKAAVVVDLPEGLLCPSCAIGAGAGELGLPTQEIAIENQHLRICESWGEACVVEQCSVLRLDAERRLRLEHHAERAAWKQGPSSQQLAFDFVALEGRREYSEEATEAGFPSLQRSTRFAMLFAHRVDAPPVLDGKLDEPLWQAISPRDFTTPLEADASEGWRGPDDAAFDVRLAWTPEALWIAVQVRDDQLVDSDCEVGVPSRSDRLELWLDLSPELRLGGDEPELDEHRRVYLQAPFRHQPDGKLLNFGISPELDGVCVRTFLPRDVALETNLLAASERVDDGYVLEIAVPARLFGLDSLDALEGRWEGIGFSLELLDADPADTTQPMTRIATSELVWGDPFSLGELFMPRTPEELPAYPLDWGHWLE